MKSISLKDSLVWKTRIQKVEFATSTSSENPENPICIGRILIYPFFSPGLVVGVSKIDGKELWRFDPGYFVNSNIKSSKGFIYIATSKQIFCINVKNGNCLWSYRPYLEDGEHFYSSPTLDSKHLYFGDTYGFLHCLDLKTGKLIWKIQTGKGKRNRVNASALIRNGKIFIANTGGTVAAYSRNKGHLIWKTKVRRGIICTPILYSGYLQLVVDKSIYFLSYRTGRKFPSKTIKAHNIKATFTTRDSIFYIDQKGSGEKSSDHLIKVKNGSKEDIAAGSFFGYGINYNKNKNCLLLSTFSSLKFFSFKTKSFVYQISLDKSIHHPSTPFWKNGKIYFTGMSKYVFCIKSPI